MRLQTLDGKPMATFISGCQLKRYHEPLTEDMLKLMHVAKTRKAMI